MELPGGLIVNKKLCRGFSFKPLTGLNERIIHESGFELKSLAEQVTLILTQTLDRVAGLMVDKELVLSLCSGDRLFLMLQLQANLDPSPQWFTSNCRHCDEKIQFQFEPTTMPVKPAGKNFPQSSVTLSAGNINLRVPCGADEEILAKNSLNEQNAMDILLQRLISSNCHNLNIGSLSHEDLNLIDQLLDEMSPQPGTSVSIKCPYCSFQQQINIDHYAWINQSTQQLDEEIHTLALNYHWSEKDILGLPKHRRQHYLQLIQRNLEIYHADDNIHASQGEV